MVCELRVCGSGEVWGAGSSVQYFQKCPSQIGLVPQKIDDFIYKATNQCGSIIKVENKVLGESVPVTGTNFELNYFSSWVEVTCPPLNLAHPLRYIVVV